MTPENPAGLREALDEVAALIELGETRALAVNGPVSHFRDELDNGEWRRLWVALSKVRAALAADRPGLVSDHHADSPHWHDPDGVTLHYAADEPGLDVERLATAIRNVTPWKNGGLPWAEAIAAEYARLSGREGSRP